MGQPYPHILNKASVHSAFSDYILQVNYQGYNPDTRKVLAVRISDRTAILRNASTPIRHEMYYFIEGEIFPEEGTTRLKEGQTPEELAEELLQQHYDQLYIWTAYDFTKGPLLDLGRHLIMNLSWKDHLFKRFQDPEVVGPGFRLK